MIDERAKRARHSQVCSIENRRYIIYILLYIIGERAKRARHSQVCSIENRIYIYIYYIPPPLTVHFSMTRSVRYQPIFNTLYYTLHTEHAYCLSYRFLNNVVITTVIEMVELVEILDRRLGKRSVERVRYIINNLLHLVIVKYGDISLVLCISTRLRLVTILSLLVKYLVIFHADPCNKSYIYYGTCNFCSYNPLSRRSVILKLLPELFVYVYVALRRALQQR